tara:strand:- start:3496 stop:5178 length:1683 start_codon:yes stop_codon:yes gene_type:complete
MLRQPFSKHPIELDTWDVIVIGAGAAGLMACLEIPDNLKVLLLNRNTSKISSSRWAQGGIAAVIRPEDSFELHFQDTLGAGDGLCDINAVNMLVNDAPYLVERLESYGMIFDREFGKISTTLEAAHSCRRVLHVQDRTGRALVEVLQDRVEERENILHCRGVRVSDLLIRNERCCGVQVLDGSNLYWINSKAVVMATGGGGHLYANTTNPTQASGEGIALAWKGGAAIDDLEFVQFHPTALKSYGAPCFLISEALRGEGAFLVSDSGTSPVSCLAQKDLAPRDQVSRALFKTMKKESVDHAFLDLSRISPEKLVKRFPNIISRCQEYGINPINQLIPIAPAAHYWMGGISTNLFAKSTLNGLYAVGEVASTGVHGANRLASNSLMECLVFARKLSAINCDNNNYDLTSCTRKSFIKPFNKPYSLDRKILIQSINQLRNLCWERVGVSRNRNDMNSLHQYIRKHLSIITEHPMLKMTQNLDITELIHLEENDRRDLNLIFDLYHRLITSNLLTNACIFRKESRGGHYRIDNPVSLPYWRMHSRQIIHQSITTRQVNLKKET